VVSSNGNSTAQKFKYNGKELEESLGLNLYDYGARFYDPATARWFTPDAMAEKYYDQSTYTYTLNNPILFVDPDGNQVAMCCDELKSFLRGLQSQGSAMTTATSQAVDNFTQPARNVLQSASDAVTLVSQSSAEMRSSAVGKIVENGKAAYGVQAQIGGAGVGLASGLRVVGTTVAKTEVIQRAMSKAELKATQSTGLLRGGRDGTHFASDAVNSTAKGAQKRLALPNKPEVRATMEVPKGTFSKPNKVQPAFNQPGGGMERTATGKVKVKVTKVKEYEK